MNTHDAIIVIAAFALAAIAPSIHAQAEEPLNVQENLESVTATVKSIDLEHRLVELQSDDRQTTVNVPPDVRNLEQLKVGDQIVVSYYQGIAVQLKESGQSDTVGAVTVDRDTARAAPGAKPGGVVTNMVTTTVVIDAVDQASNSLTFTGPSGMTRTVEVKDPSAQQLLGKLTKGDELEITYQEALAVKVEPRPAKR